jgi:hypothetical protein
MKATASVPLHRTASDVTDFSSIRDELNTQKQA